MLSGFRSLKQTQHDYYSIEEPTGEEDPKREDLRYLSTSALRSKNEHNRYTQIATDTSHTLTRRSRIDVEESK